MNSEFQWRNEMRKLNEATEPARDLWPAIENRIAAARAPRARWPRFVAAAAAVMLAFAGMVAWRLHVPEPEAARTALDWAQPGDAKLAAAARDLDSASAQLQQALEQRPDAVFLVGLLNRTNGQRMRLMQADPTRG